MSIFAMFYPDLFVEQNKNIDIDKYTRDFIKQQRQMIIEETIETRWDDIDLLAHLINVECGASWCCWDTQYYTGSVVINRVNSDLFPNTIQGVIEQPGQYSTVNYLWLYEPSEQIYNIATELVAFGTELPDNVVFQANFKQGSRVYDYIDGVYFCEY